MTTIQQNSLIFHTNGPIDPGTWELMGVSVKHGDKTIGMFGTGFKYAVSVLLRTGHQVEVFCESGKKYSFTLEPMTFRGQEFQRIYCNDQALAFTTHYGFKWNVDNAYRELMSNTMDENGICIIGSGKIDGGTSIVITGPEILKAHQKHEDIFIGEREPIAETTSINFYEGKGSIWYRGVKVGELEKANFSYEALYDVDLTEDRTLKNLYGINYMIGAAICSRLKNKDLIEKIITSKGAEESFDYDNSWSDEMMETVQKVWRQRPASLIISIQKLLQRKNPSAGFDMKLFTEDEEESLKKALQFLEDAGYKIDCQIRRVSSTDENLIAYYHGGSMHLTDKAFESGLFELITTIFEEHCHHKGYHDNCRTFEQYLMKEVIRQAKKRLKATF